MNRYIAALCAALMFVSLPSPVEAARISPMILNVKPAGSGSVARIELTNPDDTEFPVEVQMFRGEISETGELALIAADDDFLVFPTQLVVPAKAQQIIRVQYVGDPELKKSEVYYAAVRQLPIELPSNQSRVQVVVNFNVLVNVVPDGTKADPQLEVIGPKIVDATPGIDVRVTNAGSRFMTAGTLVWNIAGTAEDGTAVQLRRAGADMAKAIGVGVVAPGKSRIFFVPTDQPLKAGTIRVTLAD